MAHKRNTLSTPEKLFTLASYHVRGISVDGEHALNERYIEFDQNNFDDLNKPIVSKIYSKITNTISKN